MAHEKSIKHQQNDFGKSTLVAINFNLDNEFT